jgi:hypothetical protein
MAAMTGRSIISIHSHGCGRCSPPSPSAASASARRVGLAWRSVEADALVIEQATDRFNNLGPVKTVAALRRAPVGPALFRTLADWAARQG